MEKKFSDGMARSNIEFESKIKLANGFSKKYVETMAELENDSVAKLEAAVHRQDGIERPGRMNFQVVEWLKSLRQNNYGLEAGRAPVFKFAGRQILFAYASIACLFFSGIWIGGRIGHGLEITGLILVFIVIVALNRKSN
jgi:hypothetical protein